jgi:predicted AlkP superfamily phosphohydrolase/phosphomutase
MKQFLQVYHAFPPLKFLLRGLSRSRKAQIKTALTRSIDWSRTYVFTGSPKLQLHLYVNRAGKFAQGIPMTNAEYDELIAYLKQMLLSLRDPSLAVPILADVHETGRGHCGAHGAVVPDLVLEYANLYSPGRTSARVTSRRLEGNHTPEGILMACGPGITQGNTGPFDLIDVMPSVLYSLGILIPPDVDGRIMDALFAESVLQDTPPAYSDVPATVSREEQCEYTEEEAERVRERLRDWGYL